jgi:integrase
MAGNPRDKLYLRGGTWYARLYENGAERRVSLKTRSYQEAVRRRDRVAGGRPLEDRPLGITSAAPSRSLQELGRAWLRTYVASARNEQNAKLAAARFDRYAVTFFGASTPVSNITRLSLEEYRVWVQARRKTVRRKIGGEIREEQGPRRLAVQSVRHVLSDMRAFLLWCHEHGEIRESPLPRRFLPRAPESAPQGFTVDVAAKLRGMPGELGFTLRFLLGTGIRWSEASRARRDHVDRTGMLTISQTKNGRVRRVRLPPAVLQEIESRVGRLIPFASSGSFTRAVRRLSGVADFRVHRCRHHYATSWLERGGNLEALKIVLGHSSLAMTERYAKPTEAFAAQEAARIRGGAA